MHYDEGWRTQTSHRICCRNDIKKSPKRIDNCWSNSYRVCIFSVSTIWRSALSNVECKVCIGSSAWKRACCFNSSLNRDKLKICKIYFWIVNHYFLEKWGFVSKTQIRCFTIDFVFHIDISCRSAWSFNFYKLLSFVVNFENLFLLNTE